MENILVVGANTRAVACSLKKRGYEVYSADYFGTLDLQECVTDFTSVLSQKPYISCGNFTENFKTEVLMDMATNFIPDVDGIICLAGSSPQNFPKKKIRGNKDTINVEDKYKLYKNLKNQFKIPKSYLISGYDEAQEIITNFPQKKFILKPTSGSGGYGIIPWEETDHNSYGTDLILQERLEGDNISVSVLSTRDEAQAILTSHQIIGETSLGQSEPYGYSGNITPLGDDQGTGRIAEKAIEQLSLVGSNGVDFVIQGDDVFLIEVNPRFQGTLECAELSLGINMAEAHLEACQGNLMNLNPPKKFAVKMIVHAQERSLVGNLRLDGVYDIPGEKVIIEAGEPVATVVTSGSLRKDAIYRAEKTVEKVYNLLSPY